MSPTLLLTVNVHGMGPEAAANPGAELYGRLAHGGYAWRIGMPRLLEALKEAEAPATFFWPSSEAKLAPALLEQCLKDGHEVASHGRAFEDHAALDNAAEAAVLEESHETLRRLCGASPLGFRAPTGTLSHNTLRMLMALGYRYDSSFLDDDAPYQQAEGLLELPWSEGLSDATHFRRRLTQDRAEIFLNEELDALLPVAGYACLTVHPRADLGLVRASRLPVLHRLIDRARAAGATLRLCRDML